VAYLAWRLSVTALPLRRLVSSALRTLNGVFRTCCGSISLPLSLTFFAPLVPVAGISCAWCRVSCFLRRVARFLFGRCCATFAITVLCSAALFGNVPLFCYLYGTGLSQTCCVRYSRYPLRYEHHALGIHRFDILEGVVSGKERRLLSLLSQLRACHGGCVYTFPFMALRPACTVRVHTYTMAALPTGASLLGTC